MSQHRWPDSPTLKPMACLNGCGTTRQKYDARRWFYQAPGTMGGMRAGPCPGPFFWVYKFKGTRRTVTPPWEPVTRREPPGPTYLTDVAGWPESRYQRAAKRFTSRREARDFPRILSGAILVRVRRRIAS